MTFEQFLETPEDDPRKSELLEGELILVPPRKMIQSRIAHNLRETLEIWARAYTGMAYKLGQDTCLVPDVSIEQPNHPGDDYLEGAPILAVEIVSQANSAEHLERKVKKYLANGGQEVWVVYPKTRTVWAYRQEGAREFRGTLRSPLIEAMEIDMEAVFG